MQHDVYANSTQGERRSYPFRVVLQADIDEEAMKIVASLVPVSAVPNRSRLLSIVEHNGQSYGVILHLMTHVPARRLKRPAGSLSAWRDDLTQALDWLFFGI